MQDFRNLKVWQRAHALTLAVYEATRPFPKEEIHGLTGQVRRAASSIAANIAEGCGRDGDAERKRFLQIAMGSASELDYHLMLAHDLGPLDEAVYRELAAGVSEVKRMLAVFIVRLRMDSDQRPVKFDRDRSSVCRWFGARPTADS